MRPGLSIHNGHVSRSGDAADPWPLCSHQGQDTKAQVTGHRLVPQIHRRTAQGDKCPVKGKGRSGVLATTEHGPEGLLGGIRVLDTSQEAVVWDLAPALTLTDQSKNQDGVTHAKALRHQSETLYLTFHEPRKNERFL